MLFYKPEKLAPSLIALSDILQISMVQFLTPQEKYKLRMVVNVCVSYLPKQKNKKVRDCLQPYYLFFFVVERNHRLDTAGFDSIVVEVSFQSIGFSVSLVDLVMFGIP